MVVPRGMKLWEFLDFGTDCLCNWKGSPQVTWGLCLTAQKKGSFCQKTVACIAEGHGYSVPELKLLAVVRILEPIQEAAAV